MFKMIILCSQTYKHIAVRHILTVDVSLINNGEYAIMMLRFEHCTVSNKKYTA